MNDRNYLCLIFFAIGLFLPSGHCQENKTPEELNLLAVQAYRQGKYQQGMVFAKRAYKLSLSRFGAKHPLTLLSLNNLAGLYRSQGKYAKAEPLFRKVAKLRKQILGASHPDTLLSLNNLAGLYRSQGKYAKAEPLFRKVVKLRKQIFGVSHPDTLLSMNNLALVYYSQEKYDKAEPIYLQTLELSRQALGEKHPETLRAMNNLAGLYRAQGQYGKSEEIYLETLKLRKQVFGENHPSTLISMNNLAILYNAQGEYAKAEKMYLQTLELSKQVRGKKHPETVITMNNLAELYRLQGEYAKAEKMYLQTLELNQQVLGKKHPYTLKFMNNLAELYRSQGEYAKAEPLYLKILKIYKQLPRTKTSSTIITMSNLAVLYYSQGEYAKAEEIYLKTFESSKQLLGTNHPSTLTLMRNLVALYHAQTKYAKAEEICLKTIELSKQVLGANHPDTLLSMSNLAALYEMQEKFTQAAKLYLKTLKAMQQVLGASHPSALVLQNNLAGLYRSWGKYAQAEKTYLQTSHTMQQVFGTNHPSVLISMNNLAELYRSQGEHTKTLTTLRKLIQRKYLFLVRELQGSSEQTRLKMLDKLNVAWERDRLFSTLESYSKEDHNSLALYYLSNYKGILLRISQNLKQLFATSKDQQLLEQLSQKRSEYSRLFFASQRYHNNDPSQIKKLEKEIEKLEKQLIWNNADAARLLSDTKPEEILQALGKNELLIEFVVYYSGKDKQEKIAAVVAKQQKIEIVPVGDLPSIQRLVQEYRTKLKQQHQSQELAKEVYQKILAPLDKHLENRNKVYLVPDGILHLLPFYSLINAENEYLAQSHNVVLLSSSQDLVQQKPEKNPQPAAIFAYPDYGKGKGKKTIAEKNIHFLPLPGTQEEARAIAKTLDIPVKIYSEKQATENNISQLTSPKILHIATHGYFLAASKQEKTPKGQRGVTFSQDNLVPAMIPPPSQENVIPRADKTFPTKQLTNPLVYSGLALAGANHPNGDGILTALEVLSLHLHGTKLVVLSACETGLGEIRQGEGVYSLQRAFREAGAETVVASLWKVDDQATEIFMQKFYQRYMQGASAHKAARDTQLEFINSSRYSHPYYWSSFVVIGGRSDDLAWNNLGKAENSTSARQESSFIFWIVLLSMVGLVSGWIIFAQRKKHLRILQERRVRQERRLARKN